MPILTLPATRTSVLLPAEAFASKSELECTGLWAEFCCFVLYLFIYLCVCEKEKECVFRHNVSCLIVCRVDSEKTERKGQQRQMLRVGITLM